MPLFAKKNTGHSEVSEVREPEVRITRGTYGRLIVRRIITMTGFSLLALIVLYLCFAATWMRVVPTLSGSGLVPVKNVTYDGGIVPADVEILVDRANPQDSDLLSHIKQSFVPSDDAAVVRVITGPYGEMQWGQPNILTVDGNPIGVPFPPDSDGKSPIDEFNPFLRDEYVVECVSGACEVGDAFIVHKDNIYGVLLLPSSDEE